MFVCCRDWLFTFSARDNLIGILRKGCFVIPWCVVSVIPATVMYKRQKLVKHIYSLQKTQAGVSSIGSFYLEEGSSGFIVTEEVYLLKFISLLKLSNYWHHKWNAGWTAKIGLKLLALMSYGITVFPLWCKFRTSVLL